MSPLVLLPLLLACSWPAAQSPATSEPTRALRNLVLVDGTGRAPVAHATIAWRGERIVAIGADVDLDDQQAVESVELPGFFVLPGLMDVHVHLASAPSRPDYLIQTCRDLRRLLGTGITTVRDMAGDGRVLNFLARQTLLGDVPGPDIHFAAVLAGPKFFGDARIRRASRGVTIGEAPWALLIRPDRDLDALMPRVRGCGATGVKIYADLDPATLANITRTAKRHGLAVWSHWVVAPRRTSARDAVHAGVDVVSHAYMLMHDVAPPHRDTAERVLAAAGGDELLQLMQRNGTILDATIVAGDRLRAPPNWVHPGDCGAAIVQAALAAGVPIATGSDHPFVDDVPGIHLEYRLLASKAGMSPLQIVHAASAVGARVVGTHESNGTLAVGKEVTMLVYDQDPLANVERLAEPTFVIKRGRIYSGEALRDPDRDDVVIASLADLTDR